MTAVGIDACKSGWIVVALRTRRVAEAHYLASIEDLASVIPDAGVAARTFLGVRRNSVFFAPVREALLAPTHADANAVSLRLTGAGISQQAYRLAPKIFEVERWLTHATCPVFEVHPEVSFAELLHAPASATKKSWAGMIERRAILAQAGIALENSSKDVSARAGVDDMLDAGAAAWSAMRLLAGTARSLPASPELDSHGRQMAIWV